MSVEGIRLRVHQFARLRGVSVFTVRRWIKRGKVEALRDEGGHRWLVVLQRRSNT